MNIETLRIFCDVVQHLSFSRGAKINEVSQSAATQSVHRVEEHFGVQLVDRSKRPFVLTPEGQACYEGFREVLELYDSVEARVRSLRMEIGGLVRVAAIYSVGLHDMSRCMQDFMRQYPKAKVRLEYLRPNKVYDAVVNGEVDLGIISYPVASPDLNVIPLRSEQMVVVCLPGHPLTNSEAVTAEQLQGAGLHRLRPRPEHPQRDRSAPPPAGGEYPNRDGVRQHRDHQASRADRRRREHLARADRARRSPQRFVGGREADRPRASPADRHHLPAAPSAHAHRGQVCRASATNREPTAGGKVMRDTEVLVCFRPSGREAYVLPGTRLVEAAAEAGLVLEVPCGGEGLCGRCRVIVTSGAAEPTATERHWLSAEELHCGLAAGVSIGRLRADGGRDSARCPGRRGTQNPRPRQLRTRPTERRPHPRKQF